MDSPLRTQDIVSNQHLQIELGFFFFLHNNNNNNKKNEIENQIGEQPQGAGERVGFYVFCHLLFVMGVHCCVFVGVIYFACNVCGSLCAHTLQVFPAKKKKRKNPQPFNCAWMMLRR